PGGGRNFPARVFPNAGVADPALDSSSDRLTERSSTLAELLARQHTVAARALRGQKRLIGGLHESIRVPCPLAPRRDPNTDRHLAILQRRHIGLHLPCDASS